MTEVENTYFRRNFSIVEEKLLQIFLKQSSEKHWPHARTKYGGGAYKQVYIKIVNS